MRLWLEWWRWCTPLRGACARNRTFLWMGVVLIGFCARDDLSPASCARWGWRPCAMTGSWTSFTARR